METGAGNEAVKAPTSAQWLAVRTRIDVINSHIGEIECRLVSPEVQSDEVVRRMEALQEKFEQVMGQLAAFDDEGGQAVQDAKEHFRQIVRRYRQSRTGQVESGVH